LETPERQYTVRRLNAGDAPRVGAMFAGILGDPRLTQALQTGEQSIIAMTSAAVLLERAPRTLGVWVADLIGLAKNYDFKEYRRRMRKEAKDENLLPPSDEQVRYYMEEDIVRDLNDNFPADTYMDVLTQIMEQDEFDGFLASCKQFFKTATMLRSKFSSLSSESSDSETESS
jgi:hypothetical protein